MAHSIEGISFKDFRKGHKRVGSVTYNWNENNQIVAVSKLENSN